MIYVYGFIVYRLTDFLFILLNAFDIMFLKKKENHMKEQKEI